MADSPRKPIVDRATALLAGPFLLGQRALSLVFASGQETSAEAPAPAISRLTITPPEHAIKRRG
ncbi:MAG: hypothetical protein HXX12_12005 [Geothrix sp.]|uniref:hypothetical protein n=1 Tax=Geothrix sp. TaxID=1962974 RepID=UPI0017AE8BB9|nr:hypothetical protein [Geothrix sp.]NWJ41679.1 hypothetical protein [Geothrix sp.]WIL20340.1 MAG: hypothetical protein QOZ81_002904 [Geothrix sp.]